MSLAAKFAVIDACRIAEHWLVIFGDVTQGRLRPGMAADLSVDGDGSVLRQIGRVDAPNRVITKMAVGMECNDADEARELLTLGLKGREIAILPTSEASARLQ